MCECRHANTNAGGLSRKEILAEIRAGKPKGSSGYTLVAYLNYLEVHRPPWAFAENVKDMLDHEAEQAEVLVVRMRAIDYLCAYVLMENETYGVKVRRPRVYFVLRDLRDAKQRGQSLWQTEQQVDSVIQSIKKLKVAMIDSENILLADDDPVLVQKLDDMVKVKAQDNEKSGRLKWKESKKDMLTEAGLRESQLKATPEVAASPWFQALNSSEQFKIEFHMQVNEEDEEQITSLDVQQSPDRVPIGRSSILSCMLPSSRIFMVPPLVTIPRMLSGHEMLAFQGVPMKTLRQAQVALGVSMKEADHLYADLAGNAYSGFCASAVLISLFVHMSWGEDTPKDTPKPEAVPKSVEDDLLEIFGPESDTSIASDVDSISRICLG